MYSEKVKDHSFVKFANSKLAHLADPSGGNAKFDPATLRHSRGVNAACLVIAHSVGLTIQKGAVLTVAGLYHDYGRIECGNIGTISAVVAHAPNKRVTEEEKFLRYQRRRHPHDGYMAQAHLFAGHEDADATRGVRLMTLMHHTHNKDPRHNYPSKIAVAAYVVAKEVAPQELLKYKFSGHLLSIADFIQAVGLAPDEDRPYRTERLKAEGHVLLDGEHPITFATRIAQTGLAELPPKHDLSITDIGAIMLDHVDFLTEASN